MEQLSDISILQFQLLIQVPLYIISFEVYYPLLLYIIITSLKIILRASCFVGLEASITDSNDISAFLTDATVVAEPGDDNKIQVSHHA